MKTNFDADGPSVAPPFLDGIHKNVAKLHQVLVALLPHDELLDVFGRIYNYLDTKVPELFQSAHDFSKSQAAKASKLKPSASNAQPPLFSLPQTEAGKERMRAEVEGLAEKLRGLLGEGGKDKLETMVSLTKKMTMA